MSAMALSGHTGTIQYLSAFGAKRTCTIVWLGLPWSLMTHHCHRRANFAVMHNVAFPPTTMW
jgi:hypothetical protein